MGRVNPPDIGRPKKHGCYGEIIHDLVDNMVKQYHDIAPQVDTVQTLQTPVIRNSLDPRPTIDTIQTIDIYRRQKSKLKTIIEMFPSGTICKIHLDETDVFLAVIHGIKFSTDDLEPALHIDFFKLEDILALPAETSLDILSEYPVIQSCVIHNPGQIESIDSSDTAEMSRELIKNEMLAIKKQIAALKDNLRQLSRLRNSEGSTSRLVNEINWKYHAFVRNLEWERYMKQPMGTLSLPY